MLTKINKIYLKGKFIMNFTVINKKKLLIFTSALLVSILIFCITLGYGVSAVFNSKNQKELPIYSVDRQDKKIAISFDCAWGVDYTDRLLEIMQAENVKCTFFMVEFWTLKYPEYVKKIADNGHEIGTHSATHPHMNSLNKSSMVKELNSSKQAIEQTCGAKVELFRAPYGEYNNTLIETAKELGLYTIQWDVDSLDWKDLSANEISKRVISKVKAGSIVLFHNQGLHTADAIKIIIPELKNQGYEFVPIGELIYKDNFYVRSDGTQIKNS